MLSSKSLFFFRFGQKWRIPGEILLRSTTYYAFRYAKSGAPHRFRFAPQSESRGAKLPSVGLCLNTSKAESHLVMATYHWTSFFGRGNDVSSANSTPFRDPWLVFYVCLPFPVHSLGRGGCPKSTVDYFYTSRAVVLGRGATTLRSVGWLRPSHWVICLVK